MIMRVFQSILIDLWNWNYKVSKKNLLFSLYSIDTMLNDVRRDKIDGVVESLLYFFVFSQTFDPSNKTFSWKNPTLELVEILVLSVGMFRETWENSCWRTKGAFREKCVGRFRVTRGSLEFFLAIAREMFVNF